MKILDATIIIALFDEIRRPDLIDKILLLGHDLVVPSHVMRYEILDKSAQEMIKKMISENKMHILEKNSVEEIERFQDDTPNLGLGECDVMLSCQKIRNEGEQAYCILDDRGARNTASDLGICFTGLIGLLTMIRDRNIMSQSEVDKVLQELRDSGFRLPPNAVI